MERREAQRPTLLAARAPGPPSPRKTWVPESWREGGPRHWVRQRGLAPDPWRLPALHPLMGERKKGNDGAGPSLNNRTMTRGCLIFESEIRRVERYAAL